MTIPSNQADPNPSGGYRDQILHGKLTPDEERDFALMGGFLTLAEWQDVQDVQAPGDQAVTSGHGECECSECSSGWSAAWSAWMALR